MPLVEPVTLLDLPDSNVMASLEVVGTRGVEPTMRLGTRAPVVQRADKVIIDLQCHCLVKESLLRTTGRE
jgi:hypothetical protein